MATQTSPARQPGEVEERALDASFDEVVYRAQPSAWVCRQAQTGEHRSAPGAPGNTPRWASSAKDGVGTALSRGCHSASMVWFTLSRGALTEIFYPRIDRPSTRGLFLIVTDGQDFFSDERHDAEHRLEYPHEGVPLYRLQNICHRGRYQIEKTVFAHPHQHAVIQIIRFTPLNGENAAYRVYALLAPHLDNHGCDNTGWLGEHKGVPMLFAQRGSHALAMASSAPWRAGSVGYMGAWDGERDLAENRRLTQQYDRAEKGNVLLTGEVDHSACGGTFVLVVGFGDGVSEAGHRALASLMDDPEELQEEYTHDWQRWQEGLTELEPPRKGGRDLYRISAAVLETHHAGSIPGGLIASLSTPWGQARGDGEQTQGIPGYHLVWPRDLVQSASGLLAAGAKAEALRVLRYLRATQLADGHWPQNMWVDGQAFWTGIQLGETAFPILLLDLLRREGVLLPRELPRFWPMVQRAASYIIRSGPSTQQDRWENQRGYTPYTLSVVIASFLVAAELADQMGEPTIGTYLRETADAWNAAIESWLYVTGTELAQRLGIDGYYVRSIQPECDDLSLPKAGHLVLKTPAGEQRGIPATEVVSPDAVGLVRFGLRAPDDPHIENTLKAIDATLRVETPSGPCWHRYNGDRYGEQTDGSPFDGQPGIGRAWPLLTGERAHHELMAGRRDEAIRLLRTMASFAGIGGMIPEQVWDTDDMPDRGLFLGKPSGSAMPLCWAHAEYIKLRRSLADGRSFDTPPQTVERYVRERVGSRLAIWRFDHCRQAISPGDILRLEVLAPAVVRWTRDGWQTTREDKSRDTELGVHVIDLDTADMRTGERIELTFYWPAANRWEHRNFMVAVA